MLVRKSSQLIRKGHKTYLENEVQNQSNSQTNANYNRTEHVVEILSASLANEAGSSLVHEPSPDRSEYSEECVDDRKSLSDLVVFASGIIKTQGQT